MNIIILILYIVSTNLFGWIFVRKLFNGFPPLLEFTGAFLLGTGIGIPMTYVLSVVFVPTGAPILWGTVVTTLIGFVFACFELKNKPITYHLRRYHISVSDCLFICFSLIFSSWMMIKTFHGGVGGQLFVGSNNVFDFGMMVGLMRSISWGANIPFMSPFFAGLPFFYHYFFIFWAALWEYFGVPAVWAINVPSILSFCMMLIVIYYLPQVIAKQKPFVGWMAVLLTVTNSSLTFWKLLYQKGITIEFIRDIWRLPTYPFAGPFDGSTVSIFMTLNNYVNQRHLAFATALGIFIYLLVVHEFQRKTLSISRTIVLGILTGFLLLWNMVTYLLIIITIGLLLILLKEWKALFVYILASGLAGVVFLLPIVGSLFKAFFFLQMLTSARGDQLQPTWQIIDYLWQNLGLLPFVGVIGFFVLGGHVRKIFLPYIIVFSGMCLYAGLSRHGFEQKSLSFFIIGIDTLAAIVLGWLWYKKKLFFKIVTVLLFFVLTLSGFVDLMPIKNEFAFPLVGKELTPVISWIHASTPNNAVFVSYSDIIDPVVLAGRTNFFGFFGNIGWYDRSGIVSRIYQGEVDLAKENHISYILIPKGQKNDFPYTIDLKNLLSRWKTVYDDNRYMVFAVR